MRRRWIVVSLIVALLGGVAVWRMWPRTRGSADGGAERRRPTMVGDGRVGREAVIVPRGLVQEGAPPRRVAGIVRLDGAPHEGATVEVRLADGAVDEALVTRTTGRDGRFDLGELPAMVITIVASAPGLTPDGDWVDLRDGTRSPAPDALVLDLRRCDHVLEGHVRDASGGAIAGAAVVLTRLAPGARALTDESGSYELCAPRGQSSVSVRADGYGDASADVTVIRRARYDALLVPEAVVAGVAVGPDEAPIAGAVVQAASHDDRDGGGGATVTDDAGRFRVDHLQPGRYAMTAQGGGAGTRQPVEVVATPGVTEGLVLRLAPTARVIGRVLQEGVPLAGAQIHGVSLLGSDAGAVSQEDGSFVLDGVPPGKVTFSAGIYSIVDPRPVEVRAPSTEVTIEVAPTASARGRVLRNGQPVADARVMAEASPQSNDVFWSSAYSRHDGTYELRGLQGRTYRVSADAPDVGAFTKGVEVTVASGEVREGVDLELDLAATVSGLVVDENGRPIAGAAVALSLTVGRDFGLDVTAGDGTFTVANLSGGGAYDVTVRPFASSRLTFAPADGAELAPIQVAHGTSRVTGIRLAVRHERLAISGRVVSRGGSPRGDVTVEVSVAGDDWAGVESTAISAVDGSFALEGLVGGLYDLRARTRTGAEANMPGVAAGRDDVVLELPDAGGIDGTLVGFTTTPRITLTRWTRVDRSEYQPIADGTTFSIRELPVGGYKVTALGDGEGATAIIEVTADAVAQMTLASAGKARVIGTVRDVRSGAAVDALCSWQLRDGLQDHSGSTDLHMREGRFDANVPADADVMIRCFWNGEDASISRILDLRLERGAVREVTVPVVSKAGTSDTFSGGIGVFFDSESLAIDGLLPGRAGERAGLRAGDALVRLDGIDAEKLWFAAVQYLTHVHPVGTTIEVVVRRGGETLTFDVPVDGKGAGR